ncbi:MAG: ATP-binding protein [Bacteroidetes bacterium]|nr:ATP-binding protein [Bacteroidota bacterium]
MKEKKETIIALLEEAYKSRVRDLKQSTELGKQALALSVEFDDKALIGKSLNLLSLFSMIMGDHQHSMEMAQEAIVYFEELGDEKGIADAKYNIASINYKTDNYHLGLVNLIDCITIYRKFHDYHNISKSQKSLGTIYEYFGDQNNAVKSYEGAIEAAKIAGDLNLESNAYNNLSGVYLKQKKIDLALEIIEKSMAIKKQTGDVRGSAFAVYGRGKVYANTGKYAEAELDFLQAIAIHQAMGERLGLGMAYNKLGALYIEMGQLQKAKEILYTGLEFSTKYNIAIIKFKCDYHLYRIYKLENNPTKAVEFLESYLSEKEKVINIQTQKVIENYELITKMDTMEKEAQLQREKADIIEKKNKAEHSARVKQEFLSSMSHEIRTPLNAILTIAALLRDKSDTEEKQMLDTLKFSANNLLLIVNDILDFAKLDAGKMQLELHPANISALMQNIKNTYEGVAKKRELNLTLEMDSALAESYDMDETKIQQILANLITNAIKFTDEGDVKIKVTKLSGDFENHQIRFSITDTGIGITENNLESIFDSFSQASAITTKKHGGTGLGLAIVKKMVALHGSIIQLQSEVGKGSSFYFDIKLKLSGVAKKATLQTAYSLKDKVALLAEDNTINAMVAKKLLSNWGITTEVAVNGLEAIEKSKAKEYDFILMDIHMPEMNGFEATAHIRKYENPNMETPIFALTADLTASQEKEYMDYFNGFLTKPIEIDKLYDALTQGVE